MIINEKTAQLILDAIAWSNQDWMDAIEWEEEDSDLIDRARIDFIRFCRDRGIEVVERRM